MKATYSETTTMANEAFRLAMSFAEVADFHSAKYHQYSKEGKALRADLHRHRFLNALDLYDEWTTNATLLFQNLKNWEW